MNESGYVAIKIIELLEETETNPIQATAELIAVLAYSMAGMIPKDPEQGTDEILNDVVRMLTENYRLHLEELDKDKPC